MKNNNPLYSVEFKPVETSMNRTAYYNALLFGVNIEANFTKNCQKPDWSVTTRLVSDEEANKYLYQDSERNAVCLYFDTQTEETVGTNMIIKTCIKEIFEPTLESYESDTSLLAPHVEMDEPPFVVDHFQEENPNDLSIVSDSDYSTDVTTQEFNLDQPTLTSALDCETACVGAGSKKIRPDLKLPYTGTFLGIRLLYDLKNNKIIEVATDDGSANWYESAYQVIIYPTGLISCPLLTIAICLWVAELPE